MSTPRLGVALGHDLAARLDVAELLALARHADDAGMHAIWVTDHPAVTLAAEHTYPYSPDGTPPFPPDDGWYSPLELLTALGAATARIRVGTAVYVLPLRHPILVARATATVDRLTGGRLVFGIGVGWHEGEAAALGTAFASRGERTDEALAVIRRLWTGEPVAWDGRHHRFDELAVRPPPAQGAAVPVYVGGESPAAQRRAAALGDGWIGMLHDPPSAAAAVRRLAELSREAGRTHPPITVVHPPGIPSGAELEAYGEAGVAELKVSLIGPGEEGTLATACSTIDRLAALAHEAR